MLHVRALVAEARVSRWRQLQSIRLREAPAVISSEPAHLSTDQDMLLHAAAQLAEQSVRRTSSAENNLLFRIAATAFALSAGPAFAACSEAKNNNALILSPPLAATVIGKGRLPFHSAPRAQCAIEGVFVIPRDDLIAYAETTDGWTSVMFSNETGGGTTGWVRTSRLKYGGTVGPR